MHACRLACLHVARMPAVVRRQAPLARDQASSLGAAQLSAALFSTWLAFCAGVLTGSCVCAAVLQAGLTLDDIDVYEINEAFASQATYCVQKLGLDESKVRQRGERTRCVLAFLLLHQSPKVATRRVFGC